jgi:hypothetical protein
MMDFNRDETIEALKICTGTEQDPTCTLLPCPYGDVSRCKELLLAHSYEIIKKLIVENERLNLENAGYEAGSKYAAEFIRAATVREMEKRLLDNIKGSDVDAVENVCKWIKHIAEKMLEVEN